MWIFANSGIVRRQTAKTDQWIREGYAAQQRGNLAEARKIYNQVLAEAPAHADALFLLGEIAGAENDAAAAAMLYRRAIAANGDIPAFHGALAHASLALGRKEDAAAAFAAEDLCVRRTLEARLRHGDRGDYSPPAFRRAIPDTTLCCVDCRYYDLAAEALSRCLARCRFERALVFTDGEIKVDGVETVPIAPIASIEEYSRFMVKDLERHVQTEFVLVVQYDGYVLNADAWSDDFRQYDYIGARWDAMDGTAVGNGGFSLRSKRLLRALQDPEIAQLVPEDAAICCTYRPLLEQRYGIRFAPPALADRFSFETFPPQAPTFGFHGVAHLASLYGMSDAQIEQYRPGRLTLYDK